MKDRCPRCDSPAPHLHPAVQAEGEVHICTHDFHTTVTSQNPPSNFADVVAQRRREAEAEIERCTILDSLHGFDSHALGYAINTRA